MNTETEKTSTPGKPKTKPTTDYIRIRKETKKRILSDLTNINRKDIGKPVTPDQYISLAISLLTPEHLETLKTQSLSNKDRLQKRYQKHCAAHGKISMDDFLGVLLSEREV